MILTPFVIEGQCEGWQNISVEFRGCFAEFGGVSQQMRADIWPGINRTQRPLTAPGAGHASITAKQHPGLGETIAAGDKPKRLQRDIDRGIDPLEEHTGADDASMMRRIVRPECLHQKVTPERGAYGAHRLVAPRSKIPGLAIPPKVRPDNPCRAVERNPEERRHRYRSLADRGRHRGERDGPS
jgi:hypothetical protein